MEVNVVQSRGVPVVEPGTPKLCAALSRRTPRAANVGIGTTSPSSNLTVYSNATNPIAEVRSGPSGNFSIYKLADDRTSGDIWNIENGRSAAGGGLGFYSSNGGGTKLLIQSSGNVGIGTTSPGTLLDVYGTYAGSGSIGQLRVTSSSGHGYIVVDAPAASESGLRIKSAGTDKWFMYRPASSNDLRFNNGSSDLVTIQSGGNVGIATTSPWRTLSVTGTVGFDGLTGSTGAGSLCLDSNKQVVYNSASDNCLSSTRATKHDILDLDVDPLSLVGQLQPVSFVYNEGDGRVRYGFIAEDTAAVDVHLATYDASSTVSGIDDRSIIAILVGAVKKIWEKVAALMQSDEAQNARLQQLEEEVAALKSQSTAAGAPSVLTGTDGAPDGSPAFGLDADTATTTIPVENEPITSAAPPPSTSEAANDNEPVVADDTPNATEPEADGATNQPAEPEAQITEPELGPANDNPPPSSAVAI